MIVYWKTSTNEVIGEAGFEQSCKAVRQSIEKWADKELYLQADLLEQFVNEKTQAYARSYLKISLPYLTFEECKQHINQVYVQYQDIIQCFPYDRWTWMKKLETIQYSDYDYNGITIESKIIDQKEHIVEQYVYTN